MDSKELKIYYTYIILCEDGSYYTGYSDNPQKRFEKHKVGKGAKYTRSHKPKELVFVSPGLTKSEAMKVEYVIKQMSHQEKETMIDWWKARIGLTTNLKKYLGCD